MKEYEKISHRGHTADIAFSYFFSVFSVLSVAKKQ